MKNGSNTSVTSTAVNFRCSVPMDVFKTFSLGVDSRCRDTATCPLPNAYTVDMPTVMRNVLRAELVYAMYEVTEPGQRLLNLHVDELAVPSMMYNANALSGVLAQLPVTRGGINEFSGQRSFRVVREFSPPCAKMSKLRVRFITPDGGLASAPEHYLRFEFTCLASNAADVVDVAKVAKVGEDVHALPTAAPPRRRRHGSRSSSSSILPSDADAHAAAAAMSQPQSTRKLGTPAKVAAVALIGGGAAYAAYTRGHFSWGRST